MLSKRNTISPPAAFDERQAFGRTVFLEILRHRLSRHFPEEAAADLAG